MAVDPPAHSDEELARQSQGGDLASFEELVGRYENRIYSFVFLSIRCDADAREITQDTFVRAFSAIASFDPQRPFRSWLFAIARRKLVDCFRSRPPNGGDTAPEEVDWEDPAELLSRQDEARDLWRRAGAALPPGQFQALWLRYAEDMDIAEIARALGKTQTHVKVMLFRARHKLVGEMAAPAPSPLLAAKRASL